MTRDEALQKAEKIGGHPYSQGEIIKTIKGKPCNGGILGILAPKLSLDQNKTYEITIKETKEKKR